MRVSRALDKSRTHHEPQVTKAVTGQIFLSFVLFVTSVVKFYPIYFRLIPSTVICFVKSVRYFRFNPWMNPLSSSCFTNRRSMKVSGAKFLARGSRVAT